MKQLRNFAITAVCLFAASTLASAQTTTSVTIQVPTVQGPLGPAGKNGTNGTNGTNGAPGLAATIAIGQVTTRPAGTPATVSNAGTPNAAVLDIGIPQGVSAVAGTGSTGVCSMIGAHRIVPTTAQVVNDSPLESARHLANP